MDALDLDIEQACGIEAERERRAHVIRQTGLRLQLAGQEALSESWIIRERGQPFELLRFPDPRLADRIGEQRSQGRIDLFQPSAMRHAIGLVLKTLGPQRGEIRDERLGDQPGMQRGYAVHRVAPDNREVRHADTLPPAFPDEGHALNALLVAGPALSDLLKEAIVNLVNDLEVARQDLLQQFDWPRLQSLRHQRVVGVPANRARPLPGLIPFDAVLVNQRPHQLGHRQRGMRIVHLQRHALGQLVQSRVVPQIAAHDVAHGARDQKILL
jgi:hypothetical protein